MAEAGTRRRFTIDEYHRMGEAGILGDDERLELIAGHIVVREPIGSRHAGTVDRLNRLWTSRVGERAIVRVQNPVVLPHEASELQPDIMLLAPRAAWLCDLTTGRVDVHRDVTGGRYATVRTYTAAQPLSAQAFPDVAVSIAELLGPA